MGEWEQASKNSTLVCKIFQRTVRVACWFLYLNGIDVIIIVMSNEVLLFLLPWCISCGSCKILAVCMGSTGDLGCHITVRHYLCVVGHGWNPPLASQSTITSSQKCALTSATKPIIIGNGQLTIPVQWSQLTTSKLALRALLRISSSCVIEDTLISWILAKPKFKISCYKRSNPFMLQLRCMDWEVTDTGRK